MKASFRDCVVIANAAVWILHCNEEPLRDSNGHRDNVTLLWITSRLSLSLYFNVMILLYFLLKGSKGNDV